MIVFLRKYWINILLMALLTVLFFFFIPNEESRYFPDEKKSIGKISAHIAAWTVVAAFSALFIYSLRFAKHITGTLLLLVWLAYTGFALFLVLQPVFLSSALWLNQMSA